MCISALSRARRRGGVIAPGIPVLLTLASLSACGDSTSPADQVAGLEAVSGLDLVGTVAKPLGGPLRVKVIDGRGNGVVGAEVEFIASPGGFVEAASGASAENSALHHQNITVPTGGDGTAAVNWVLGERAGEQTLAVRVSDLPPIEFRATAQPGPPAALVVTGGDNQLGVAGEVLKEPLTVRLRDSYGNGVAGRTVAWQTSASEARLSAPTSQTGENGEASVALTLGQTVGLRSVTAAFEDLDPVEFVSVGLNVVVEDEAGDTFSHGISGFVVLPDVTAFGAGWEGDSLFVGVTFNEEVSPSNIGGPNLMGGNLDFDTDLNAATGEVSSVDVQRRAGEQTGMGVDLYVDMFARTNGDFVVFAFSPGFRFVGRVTPTFRRELVTFVLPPDMIDTDSLRMALVVATAREATDIAPDNGAALLRRSAN